MYPPTPARHTNYRQQENAGLPLNTSDLDSELTDTMSAIEQINNFLRLLAASDGTLKSQVNAAFSSFAGQQTFTASGQSVFNTSIPYTAAATNLTVVMYVGGLLVAPGTVALSAYSANGVNYLSVNTGAPVTGTVVIQAFDSNTTQIAQQFTSGSGQSSFQTTIPYSTTFTAQTVDVFVNGLRRPPSGTTSVSSFAGNTVIGISPAANSGDIVVVLVKGIGTTILQRLADLTSFANGANMVGVQDVNGAYGATTVEGCLYEIRFLFDALATQLGSIGALWTRAGTSLDGQGAGDNFDLGSQRIINLAAGSADSDAATVGQVKSLTLNFTDLLGLFIRKDGTVAFTADQSMGNFNLKDVKAGVADGDAVNHKQMADADAALQAEIDTLTTGDMAPVLKNGTTLLVGHWIAGDPANQLRLAVAPGSSTIAIYKNGSTTPLVKETDWTYSFADNTKIGFLAPQLPVLPTDLFTVRKDGVLLVQNVDWSLVYRQIKGVMPGTDPNDVATVSQLPTSTASGFSVIQAVHAPDDSSTDPTTAEVIVSNLNANQELLLPFLLRSVGEYSSADGAGTLTEFRPNFTLHLCTGLHIQVISPTRTQVAFDVANDNAWHSLLVVHVDGGGDETLQARVRQSGATLYLTLRMFGGNTGSVTMSFRRCELVTR